MVIRLDWKLCQSLLNFRLERAMWSRKAAFAFFMPLVQLCRHEMCVIWQPDCVLAGAL